MEYIKYELGAYNLNVIKTNNFKTVRVEVKFRNVVKKEEISGGSGSGNVPPTTTIEFATDKEIEDAIQSIINSYEQGKN